MHPGHNQLADVRIVAHVDVGQVVGAKEQNGLGRLLDLNVDPSHRWSNFSSRSLQRPGLIPQGHGMPGAWPALKLVTSLLHGRSSVAA